MGEWSEDDSTTSGESATIYTEATETIEPQENPEEEWTVTVTRRVDLTGPRRDASEAKDYGTQGKG